MTRPVGGTRIIHSDPTDQNWTTGHIFVYVVHWESIKNRIRPEYIITDFQIGF